METALTKAERELAGHIERFLDQGFNIEQAELLIDKGVTWREAAALTEKGCDPLTAIEILR